MNKKNSALIVFGLIALGFSMWYQQSATRAPSGEAVFSTPNLQILREIPLVKNVEVLSAHENQDTEVLTELFNRFADRNRNENGDRHRGTHAKGKCFKGQIEIFTEQQLASEYKTSHQLSERLKQGLWKYDGVFPATIRFANANGMGKINSDSEPDVRGFSFSVQGPSQIQSYSTPGRQDFMFNSSPQFASGEIHEFTQVVKAANLAVYGDFSHLPELAYTFAVARDLGLINSSNKDGANLVSLARFNYWSNLAYTHGMANDQVKDIVKYKATPCAGSEVPRVASTTSLSPDYLQDEILKASKDGKICMLIQVQFFDLEVLRKAGDRSQKKWQLSEWVENGGLLWDESVLPFHTLARVTVPANSSEAVVSCESEYINTRLHSNPENQPVGSIARVRTLIEEVSRARRMGNL